jgi:hypothetical protein
LSQKEEFMLLSIFIGGAGTSFRGIPLSVETMMVQTWSPDAKYWGDTYGGSFGLAAGGIVCWEVPGEFEHLFLNLQGKRLRVAIYQPVIARRDVDCEIWVYDRPDGTATNISRRAMPCAGNLLGTVDATATLTEAYNLPDDESERSRQEELRSHGVGATMTPGRARHD